MSLINFKLVYAVPMNVGSTMTSEQVLQEQQVRENHFRRASDMVNSIIANNPMILSYYWYLWTCRDRQYSPPYVAEEMTRQMVRHMPLPTEEQRSFLQQHLNKFTVILDNCQVKVSNEPLNACTFPTQESPYIAISPNIFDIDNDNDRSLFVAVVILHELVHCFEPVHVDLAKNYLLYCTSVDARRPEDVLLGRIFEQGEIFEIMIFGAIFGRNDSNTLLWQCSEFDQDFRFVTNQHQYNHFFVTYDVTIIRNLIQRKKRRVLVRNYFRSIGQRIRNYMRMLTTPTNS